MGRPKGTTKTEPSDLVARIRDATKMRQQDLAAALKIGISTVRRYEAENLIPTEGHVRDALAALAKKHSLTIP